MLLTSCQSTKSSFVPYPEFPDLPAYVKNTDGTISVPEDWIVRLAEFRIKYETIQEVYNGQ